MKKNYMNVEYIYIFIYIHSAQFGPYVYCMYMGYRLHILNVLENPLINTRYHFYLYVYVFN